MALSSYDIRFILSVSDRTGNSLRRVGSDMRGVAADAARMRKAFTALDVGRGLQLRGLLGGAALGAAAQQAANFSTQVTKAATQVAGNNSLQQIGKNVTGLQKEILDLMGQFPASAQEQADAAYDIFSAMNVPLKQGVGLLKLFNMVAVAGATDLETATNAMITIINNFGGSWEQTMKAVNTSFAIIRFGRLEFSEFNDMLNSVVPAAKAAGMSLEDVSGAMAMVTKLIPSQKQGATAISRLLEVISRPDFRRGAERLGLDIETAEGALRPLPKIIQQLARLDIAQATSTINSLFQVVTATGRGGGRGIQSTVQARRALILLVKEYQEYERIQREVTGATSEFEKRYTFMIGSAGVKWEKFKAQMQALLILIGTAAIPLFTKLGEKVSNAIDWARQNKGTIGFITKLTLLISVASLVSGTLLKMYGTLLILRVGFGAVSKAGVAAFAALNLAIRLHMAQLASAFILWKATSARFLVVAAAAARASAAIRLFGATMAASLVAATAFTSRLMGLGKMLALLVRGGPYIVAISLLIEFKDEIWKKTKEALGDIAKGMGGAIPLGIGPHGQRVKVSPPDLTLDKNKTDKQKKVIISDYQKQVNEIKRLMKLGGAELFNKKMMKDLGFDQNALQEQINNLVNQPPGGTDKQRMANDIANNYKDIMKQATDKLVEVYQGFREQNQQAMGSIFEPIEGEGEEAQLRKQWNWTGAADSLLANMKERVRQFREWRNSLTMLLKKGFSKDFVEEFKKMGPEGMKHLDELKKAGPRRVREFNTVFAAGKQSIEKATEIDFNKQINKWNSFGKDTAFAIITGMESEEQQLQTRMNSMVSRLYSGIAMTIAQEQAKLNFAIPVQPSGKFGISPVAGKGAQTVSQRDVRAAGLDGRYAIPSAATGGLPVAAVRAMGDRGTAMAAAWMQRPQGAVTNVFQIDGTFLTPEEMITQALRQANHKTKNKR